MGAPPWQLGDGFLRRMLLPAQYRTVLPFGLSRHVGYHFNGGRPNRFARRRLAQGSLPQISSFSGRDFRKRVLSLPPLAAFASVSVSSTFRKCASDFSSSLVDLPASCWASICFFRYWLEQLSHTVKGRPASALGESSSAGPRRNSGGPPESAGRDSRARHWRRRRNGLR
jgi:hypothetical protein